MIGTFLGLGSNLGDRLSNLQDAVVRLGSFLEIVGASPVVESRALGMAEGTPDFLNAVVECRTRMEPKELLDLCHEVEAETGRSRQRRSESRTLDVDILFVGDRVIREGALIVPHPRWKERGFVLLPLLHLAPDHRDPVGGRTVTDICGDRERLLTEATVVAPPNVLCG